MYQDQLETEKRLVKMKVSEITIEVLKNYVRVDFNDDDTLLNAILVGSKSFVAGYTGLTTEDLDLYEDITIAVLVISAEMYENRSFQVDFHDLNTMVKYILMMHATNHL
jgi:uncharacterized phage protein (predicted DNA packaging)